MLPLEISKTDAHTANIERKKHKSAIVRERMHMIYLLYKGFSRKACAQILDCSPATVTSVIRLYNEGGLAQLRQMNYYRPVSCLLPFQNQIETAVSDMLPGSIRELREWILEHTGLDRSVESIRVFLKSLKIKYRKSNSFPGGKQVEEWLEKQEEFKEKELFPALKNAALGDTDLLFLDTAHFVQGSYRTYIWSKEPRYFPSAHGRYRVNVLAGLDPANAQILSYYNDSYINACSITGFFQWLREQHYPDQKRKLVIILDNARYQKCELVSEKAREYKIELLYLPAYSPNLNIIERLWKWMKKQLAKGFVIDKTAFVKTIENLLMKINTEQMQEEFQSMFSLKFQTFEKSQLVTG